MATRTLLQLVNETEIEYLKADPNSITNVNKPIESKFTTNIPRSINHFLVGNAYPGTKNSLRGMLSGYSIINTQVLECGNFGIISPNEVKKITQSASKINYNSIFEKVKTTVENELEDAKVEDWRILTNNGNEENPAKVLISEIKHLIDFYEYTESKKMGVVTYSN